MAYDAASATLTLEHNYPSGNGVQALVDIRLLLEKAKEEHTRIGEWVNVIGYIHSTSSDSVADEATDADADGQVRVQALMLWSTGPLDVREYEQSVSEDVASHGPVGK